MTSLQKRCLLAIVDKTLEMQDDEILCMDLPINMPAERTTIARYLENEGYISKLQIIGQNKIGCKVEEKALMYALKIEERRNER